MVKKTQESSQAKSETGKSEAGLSLDEAASITLIGAAASINRTLLKLLGVKDLSGKGGIAGEFDYGLPQEGYTTIEPYSTDSEEEPDTFSSAFAHNMESIKESRTRLHAIQQEIDAYKMQARDLIAKLQGA